MQITAQQLQKLGASPANAQKYVDPLNQTFTKFSINTLPRIEQFLAQTFEESGALSNINESLSYSAQRMVEVWPGRFPNVTVAAPYAMNPQALADKVYAGRGGNTGPNDGYLYRGRGLIQITFKDTYSKCGQALGVDLIANPDLLLQPLYAALSAGWFWHTGTGVDLDIYADHNDLQDFMQITRRINGGLGNEAIREKYWAAAKQIFIAQ